MKTKSEKTLRIIIALCEAVIGIPLLINPQAFTTIIFIAIGVFLVIFGGINVIGYFRMTTEQAVFSQKLTLGIISAAAGIFCALNAQNMMTFQVLLYGIFTLVLGIVKVQWTVNLLRMRMNKWYIMGISALVTIVFSIIIICNLKAVFETISLFIAISLIVEAVADLLSVIFSGTSDGSTEIEAETNDYTDKQ